MKMIRPLAKPLLLTVSAAIAFFSIATADNSESRPNIILILADDSSSKEYSIHGGEEINTPALDFLVKEGLHFRTAWAAPVCGPARSILLTGRYIRESGLGANGGGELRDTLLSYPQLGTLMRDAGYKTALYGKLHHGGSPDMYGFDEYAYYDSWEGYTGKQQRSYAREGMYSVHWYWHPGIVANGTGIPTKESDFGPEIVCGRMLDFITENKERPFFVFWPTNLPHHEFNEAEDRWYRPDVPELDEHGLPTGKIIPGSLKSNLEYLDGKLARIRQHLTKLGIADNTIIIYTTDNGTAGYGKGKAKSSIAVRVPLVVGGDSVPKLGARDELVDFSDILPTLLELAGGNPPEGIDGHSFAPLLKGSPFRGRTYIHSQGALQSPPEQKGTIGEWTRDGRWLLDANDDLWDCGDKRDERKYRKADMNTEPAKEAMARLKAARQTCAVF